MGDDLDAIVAATGWQQVEAELAAWLASRNRLTADRTAMFLAGPSAVGVSGEHSHHERRGNKQLKTAGHFSLLTESMNSRRLHRARLGCLPDTDEGYSQIRRCCSIPFSLLHPKTLRTTDISQCQVPRLARPWSTKPGSVFVTTAVPGATAETDASCLSGGVPRRSPIGPLNWQFLRGRTGDIGERIRVAAITKAANDSSAFLGCPASRWPTFQEDLPCPFMTPLRRPQRKIC